MVKKLILPVGLLLALLTALLAPTPGVYLKNNNYTSLLIALIFFINGLNINLKHLSIDRALLKVIILSIVISFFIGPIFALTLTTLFKITGGIATGLLIMSAMPTTISSGIVMTEISRGDVTVGLLLTVLLNLSAVVILPITIPFLFNGTTISVSAIELIKKLIVLVLSPFSLGYFLKNHFLKVKKYLGNIPSICVVIIIYASLSNSRSNLIEISILELPVIVLGALAIHILLFFFSRLVGKFFKLNKSFIKPLAFTSSQKTLPMAVTIISTMNGVTAISIIVCILFHFSQLFIDSFIASKWKN